MFINKILPDNYFRNNRHKSLANIVYTCNWIIEKVKAVLEKEDLTPQQYNILRILSQSIDPISTLQIREMMLDKMSDTSRIVERLQKKDLVNKLTNKYDKRLVDVSLTSKGMILLNRLEKNADQIDSIIDNLTNEDITQLNTLLDKIRNKSSIKVEC